MRPIPFDLRCANCGYNLRGRPPLASCSECGAPVGETIVSVSLDERSRTELLRVAGFRSWSAVSIPLLGAGGAAAFIAALVTAPSIGAAAGTVATALAGAAAVVFIARFTARIASAPRVMHLAIVAAAGAPIAFFDGAAALLAFGRPQAPALVCMAATLLPTMAVPAIARVDRRRLRLHQLAAFAVQIPAALVVSLAPRG